MQGIELGNAIGVPKAHKVPCELKCLKCLKLWYAFGVLIDNI
jgi:hypothetical protein